MLSHEMDFYCCANREGFCKSSHTHTHTHTRTHTRTHTHAHTHTRNSCNMGERDLPNMYARGPRAYISGESRAPMLQVLCITSGTLKVCLTYRFCFAYLYNHEYSFWLWFFYLTFRWRLFIPYIIVFPYNTVFTWKLALRNRDKWWV